MSVIPADEVTAYTWPACCKRCKTLQPTFRAGFSFDTTIEVRIGKDSKLTPCPDCGGERVTFPGHYRISNSGVHVISGPFSAGAILAISKLLQTIEHSTGRFVVHQPALRALAGAHPDLAAIVELLEPDVAQGLSGKEIAWWIFRIVLTAAQLSDVPVGDNMSRIVEPVIEQQPVKDEPHNLDPVIEGAIQIASSRFD